MATILASDLYRNRTEAELAKRESALTVGRMKILQVLLPLAACGLLVYCFQRPAVVPERYDLVIENARIADGTGGALTNGSIAIREGRIVADRPG